MFDPNFKRTVVLMTDNNQEGGIGFVLNRPTDKVLSDVILDINDFDARLYNGGPVQPETLDCLHSLGRDFKDSEEIVPGLYWGGDFEQLKLMIDTKAVSTDNFRFFVGYAGWSPGQLETELAEKSWIVTKSDASHVFTDENENDEMLWKRILRKMGGDYRLMSTFPEDPRYN